MKFTVIVVGVALLIGSAGSLPAAAPASVPWKAVLRQPDSWYGTDEAARVADNVLLYQHNNGGWVKNVDMATPLSAGQRAELEEEKSLQETTTIDNGATWTQLEFLARVAQARRDTAGGKKYQEAFQKGIDYLLSAQYPHGGWPQYYPLRKGYYTHITFNDDAMIGVMTLLRDVARGQAPYRLVDAARRERAATAVQKGIDCILKCQIVVDGKKTGWGQQHDETTFAPAPARKFEPVSLTASETTGIVRFLMEEEKPSPAVREAITAAVAWLDAVKIGGIRVETKPAAGTPKGTDRVVVADAAAAPLWSRLYEIGTNRPIFCGRDSVIKYRLADIEYERRNGYSWYGTWPLALLEKEYPRWKRRVEKA